jgi:hypothetical protein
VALLGLYPEAKERQVAKYMKKPIAVEAVQWWKLGDHPAVVADDRSPTGYAMHTLENQQIKHEVKPGDWIITGTAGEHYPHCPVIFAQNYVRVSE